MKLDLDELENICSGAAIVAIRPDILQKLLRLAREAMAARKMAALFDEKNGPTTAEENAYDDLRRLIEQHDGEGL